MQTDESIIESVLKGRVGDYRELIQRYQARTFRFTLSILHSREEAEDAVQETFLKAYDKLCTCRERCKFWSWLRRIALRNCLDRLSMTTPHESLDECGEIERPGDISVEAEVIRNIETARVREAVVQLPPTYRTVIVLRYMEDLSYKEIAELIGEPVSRIQVWIHRAKKMLARRLEVVLNEVH